VNFAWAQTPASPRRAPSGKAHVVEPEEAVLRANVLAANVLAANVMAIRSFAALKKASGASRR